MPRVHCLHSRRHCSSKVIMCTNDDSVATICECVSVSPCLFGSVCVCVVGDCGRKGREKGLSACVRGIVSVWERVTVGGLECSCGEKDKEERECMGISVILKVLRGESEGPRVFVCGVL